MYHNIEFTVDLQIDLEINCRSRMERVLIPAGARVRAQLRPHVLKSIDGPVEAADLFLDDGTAVRDVRFAFFRFVEE